MGFFGDAWQGIKDTTGDITGGLFGPRTEGQYAGVSRQNFDLPGFGPRNEYFNSIMTGRRSLSALQAQQANDAAIAQQRSMAAGAAPGNQGLAQLSAMQNAGRLQQGLAQQQQLAGIAERNAAAQSALENARAQQQGTMGYEGNRTARANAALGTPTAGENFLGAAIGGAKAAAMMATGGVVTQPTNAIVGEAGPEAVIPLAQLPTLLMQMQRQGVGDKYMQNPPPSMNSGPPPAMNMIRPQELSRMRPPIVRPEELRREHVTPPAVQPPVTVIFQGGGTGRTRQTAKK